MEEYNVAWQLEGQGKADEAIPRLKAIIAKDKTFWHAYGTLADAYAQKQELDKAEQYFRTLLAEDPRNGLAYYGLGVPRFKKSEWRAAADLFQQCHVLDPKTHICALLWFEAEWNGNLKSTFRWDPDNLYLYPARLVQLNGQLDYASACAVALRGIEMARAQQLPEVEATLHEIFRNSSLKAGDGHRAALQHSEESVRLYQKLLDLEGELSSSALSAESLTRLGEVEKARERFAQRLNLARKLGHRRWQVECLGNFAEFYRDHGKPLLARDLLNEAKTFTDQLAPSQVVNYLLDMVDLSRASGRLDEALGFAEEAHREATEFDVGEDGFALRTVAMIRRDQGDFVRALKFSLQSVDVFRKWKWMLPAAASLSAVAEIYAQLGDLANARKYYQQSLNTARQYHDMDEQARLSIALAKLEIQLQSPRNSLAYLNQARAILERNQYPSYQAEAALTQGQALRLLGRQADAFDSLHEGIGIARSIRSRPLEGQCLVELGECQLESGMLEEAERNFSAALEMADSANLVAIGVAGRRGLSRVWSRKGDWARALQYIEGAVDSLEAVRNRIPTSEFRAGFLDQNWKVYEEAVDVLSHLHEGAPEAAYDQRAFACAERSRARSFLDMLVEAKARVTKGLSTEEASSETALLAAVSHASAAVLKDNSLKNREALGAAERHLSEWTMELRVNSPQYLELRYPKPFSAGQVQQTIAGRGTAIVEYMLGAERSHAWVITESRLWMVPLPSRAQIADAVMRYRNVIAEAPKGAPDLLPYVNQSAHLYQMLVAPLIAHLNGAKHLVIVPDGILHYLPYESLMTSNARQPQRFLVEDFTVAYAPSASAYCNLRAAGSPFGSTPTKQLAAYGDPVFSLAEHMDPGHLSLSQLTRSIYERDGIRFTPLPNTRTEVLGIGRLFPPEQRMIRLGRDATKVAVQRANLSDYRIVHFATHAVVDEKAPSHSGVVLSLVNTGGEDGVLRMPEIFNLELNADLVVLSACQTGLGKLVKGEGMVGLTRAFMYAGTPRVAVSLWSVNDLATAEFMKQFYRHMRDGQSPGDALRLAKLDMLHSGIPAYRHPYFWAPFVLVGLE
jgi:CHAT domain-containing protein